MSFAQLFRKSTFSRFNPRIPFIFARNSQPAVLPESPLQFEAVERPSRFGLKSEPPLRQYGKSIDFISLTALDGDFEMPVFTDAKDRVLKRKIFNYLDKLLATGGNELPRVPGRVIESCEGGFLIGIGPVRAHLPQSEIPAGVNFNYYDMLDRKAYYFNLKSIQPIAVKNNCAKPVSEGIDIFSVDHGHDQKSSKKQVSLYSKYSHEQGFKVILTLRK